ncbi:hypothetical protein JP09_007335 [Dehalogenimonas etheniformans]|uniref:DUF4332 domain-containing protein n=2 Tax=Dehalogenimonas etheniformans TaxID=1536648 RepID=A0A2P5P743_9CHLR|nr:hypothetical protein JP09_007335 [Dehalogenimonas etheniformans]
MESLRAQVGSMKGIKADLDTCQTKTAQQNVEIERLHKELAAFKPDDLTIIEGIGLKIGELLNQNGIHTFAQLATTSVQRLQTILNTGGTRFAIADPGTWPEQAKLARDGKWDAFKTLTDNLKGGRRTE